jgi:hypothetical protein
MQNEPIVNGGNSIKFYDKQGLVLRAETTIARPGDFKTCRRPEGWPEEEKRWLPLRRLPWKAELSRKANDRYLEVLGVHHRRGALV